MTRAEALTKLLALGGLTEPEAAQICGWPRDEFADVLQTLLRMKQITFANIGRGMRVYQLA